MRHLKKAALALVFAAASLGGLALGYPWLEPARLLYDVHGIDVSHHQGEIDWTAVAGDGVGFAFIKATEGGDFVDPRFAENWKASAEAGVPRGAYHFFTQCRSGAVQAENFIRTVPKDAKALPPVVDAEHMGPCRNSPQVNDVVKEIAVFLDRLKAHYGLRPLIYTTREFHDAYLTGRFAQERFWIRSLVIPPRFRQAQWTVWQYHNRGRRAGIKGPVDLNVLSDGPSELAALLGLSR
ncbi:MAG: glycoside hydrolase family 25 protein [Hyphomicrobiales bacterium]